MNDEPTPGPRRARIPFKDRLGELCEAGRESAAYLWQVPDDDSVRRKIADLLTEIKAEAAEGGPTLLPASLRRAVHQFDSRGRTFR